MKKVQKVALGNEKPFQNLRFERVEIFKKCKN